jgi:hypothetical protein
MPNVTFKFSGNQAVMSFTIQDRSNLGNVTAVTFQAPGNKNVPLSNGTYDVGYRAVGTPGTSYGLQTTAGGTMNAISRTLASNGQAAGVRTLMVP